MRAFILGFLFLAATFGTTTAFAADGVGTIDEIQGAVTLVRGAKAKAVRLHEKEAVHRGDVIRTGAGAHVRVVFADGTEITMAEKGELTVDDFVYDPAAAKGNKARFSILKTAFMYVGGFIDKARNADVELRLDLGNIGIRGTRIYRTMQHGECWVYVEEGAIAVHNDGGAVSLIAGQGTIMRSRATAPTLPRAWTKAEIATMKAAVAAPAPDKSK